MTPEGWFDVVTFERNMRAFPEEELEKYWGRHVAWSADGTCIVADGATREEVRRRLKEIGVDPCSVVSSFVHDPGTSYI